MNAPANKSRFLPPQMADHEANWSLGTFGAIAEVHARRGRTRSLSSKWRALSPAVTARGGIRSRARARTVRLFASESTTRESWSHRVSLCLPEARLAP